MDAAPRITAPRRHARRGPFWAAIGVALWAAALPGHAQRSAPPDEPAAPSGTLPIGHGVYLVRGRANATFVVGSSGVMLIDTMTPGNGALLRQSIAAVTPLPIACVINTHFHLDHTGSNATFGALHVPIIAQANVLRRVSMSTQNVRGETIAPAPAAARPTATFAEHKRVQCGGVRARLVHLPHAHTDGDLYVWLPAQDVLVSGDVAKTDEYPFWDAGNGGTLAGTLAGIRRILARMDAQTVLLPGHGGPGDRRRLQVYLAMMERTRDTVAALKRRGESVDAVLARRLLASDRSAGEDGPDFRDLFVRAVYESPLAP
ncbi:MAG TPA: MBL fold metallo-hydrolase [Steroidobacteraceae bacterium]|nr:MBL fold metallo-hydrolase [Steroidobacteraceae bacterium]